jgi:hypothetical protein
MNLVNAPLVNKHSGNRMVIGFFAVRIILFLSLPLEGIQSYGDLNHFHGWAQLAGWPFLEYWMEFPPLFPLLAEILFRLAGGREHTFHYALALLFTLAQTANLALFLRIAYILNPSQADRRGWMYFTALVGLFYGWTYLDPLAVLALLAGAYLLLREDRIRSALLFGLGALVKWFPLLGLAALAKKDGSLAWRPLLAGAAVVAAGWGTLLLASPDYTLASLRSQSAKGSWETIWALLDGNLTTGNFGAKEERYDPATALQPLGHPPVISPLLTLIPFAALGAWATLRADLTTPRGRLALIALALCLFCIWSPGWSPQWVLYFLPFILLLLPERRAVLITLLFVLISLLEWPLLLSRGMFWGLYLTVPLRTLLIALLGYDCWRMLDWKN